MLDVIVGESRFQVKDKEEFRNYVDSKRQECVRTHYRDMRSNQCVDYVRRMHEKYSFADGKFRAVLTIREAFKLLESYVDSSDPDVTLPNMVHMLQTSEGLRRDGHPDWMQLVGLIHDMGKMMFAIGGVPEDGQMGTGDASQWGLGGDTWVVGCQIPDVTVFPEFNSLSPDAADSRYNTPLGMYSAHCGLHNLHFAYGHDEYMYQMLVANECKIPADGLAMVRFHSCYPWHTGGAYRQFMTAEDHAVLPKILAFNKYDLYTKDEMGVTGNIEELWAYYQPLVDKYLGSGKLRW